MNTSSSTKKIAKMGILAAISIVLVALIHFPIFPSVAFLEYDPADVPIMLAAFALGPGAGLLLTVIASLIQGLTVSSGSGWYGIVMHILATGVYVFVAGSIYKKKKSKQNAIKAIVFGIASWVVIMVPANLILTPLYLQMMGLSAEIASATVKGLLIWIVLFNLVKSIINSVITFLLYKRVSGILHK